MKLFSKKLFRLVLIEGLLWGMTIAFGFCSLAASRHTDSWYASGVEFILFCITFVACLGVNAWAIHVEGKLPDEKVSDKEAN